MFKILWFVFVISLFFVVQCSVQACPTVNPVQNFDFDKYMGRWYEQRRYSNAFEEEGCVSETLEKLGTSIARVTHFSEGIYNTSFTGVIKQKNQLSGDGYLTIKYDVENGREHDYIVLDTDYIQYSVVWSCSFRARGKSEFAWVLTREKHPSKDLMDKIQSQLDSPIDAKKLIDSGKFCETDIPMIFESSYYSDY